MRLLKNLILDPVSALKEAKRKKDINKSLIVLLANSILLSLAALILMIYSKGNYLIAPTVFVLNVFALILFGFLLELVFLILGGKGRFYEGLTSLAYAEFPFALALLISSVFFPFPAIGLVLSLVLTTVLGLIGLSTFYRSIRELFDVDWIVVWIGIGIIVIALVIAAYLTIPFLALTKSQLLAKILPAPI